MACSFAVGVGSEDTRSRVTPCSAFFCDHVSSFHPSSNAQFCKSVPYHNRRAEATPRERRKRYPVEFAAFNPLTRDWFSGGGHVGRCRLLGNRKVDGGSGVLFCASPLPSFSEQCRWQ